VTGASRPSRSTPRSAATPCPRPSSASSPARWPRPGGTPASAPSSSPTPAPPSAPGPTCATRPPRTRWWACCGSSSSCPGPSSPGSPGTSAPAGSACSPPATSPPPPTTPRSPSPRSASAVSSLPLLPRTDPRALARYYLTGERFDAAEAARIGLLTASGADVDEVLAPVLDGLRRSSPEALAATKRLLTARVLENFDRDAADLTALSAGLFASDHAREGMTAFLERRDPTWVV